MTATGPGDLRLPAWRRLGDVLAASRRATGAAAVAATPVLDLFVRLWLAQTFLVSGALKVANWEVAVQLATHEYPVSWLDPVTAAALGAAVELVCPLFLIAGLMTRVAAVPLLVLSLVIQFSYLRLPEHLLWAVLFGHLFVRGAGALSLDHMLAPALARTALPFARPLRAAAQALSRDVEPVYRLFVRLFVAAAAVAAVAGSVPGAGWVARVLAGERTLSLLSATPDQAAGLVALACAALLAVGALARGAAIALAAVTLAGPGAGMAGHEHVLWLAILADLALCGPGRVSVDQLVLAGLRRVFPQLDGRPAVSLDGAPRVVIVGAGFGGMAAARALRLARARVTLIDQNNHHLFQPLLYQVATAALSPADIASPIRAILRDQVNATVLLGRVTGIDARAGAVLVGERRVPYDVLVLATGARHGYFGRDAWESHAPGLKDVDDATVVRRRILLAFERAEATADAEERRKLLTFVLVGAGPTGVELAGAIAELARFGMDKDFRNFDPAEARVILVQAGDRVLPAFHPKLSAVARESLERLGIEVQLNSRVEAIDTDGVVIAGRRIAARTVLWTAGVVASPAARWLGAETDNAGRLKVNPDLSVPGHPEVFAIGDAAAIFGADGGPVPGLAPAAKQAGEYVARAIRARMENRRAPAPFRYRHLGSLATIGRKAAVADFGLVRISGTPAWWLWGLVHVAFLVGMRNRASVLLHWLWAYLTWRSGSRLITGDEPAPAAAIQTAAA